MSNEFCCGSIGDIGRVAASNLSHAGRALPNDFALQLAAAVERADSIGGVEEWLSGMPGVGKVQLTDYLLKSNPPKRRLLANLTAGDGSLWELRVDVYDLGPRGFRLADFDSHPATI